MADRIGTPTEALGELRGLLSALAWANEKCNHSYTFSVEELPAGADVRESLTRHFGEWANRVSTTPVSDWRESVGESLARWLFQFGDQVRIGAACAFTDEGCQRKMMGQVVEAIEAGLQPQDVWRVDIDPRGFYECDWNDFAFRGPSGLYLLHLGVSD